MSYTSWFIPICIVVSSLFAVSVVVLSAFTLVFRAKVVERYNRGLRVD